MAIWYLSFAGDEGWLGCIHTSADTFLEAVAKTHALGINPGGEVVGLELPERAFTFPQGERVLQVLDQFLDREALEALNGPVVKIPDEFFG